MEGFALALAFDTNTTEFVRGVEVGRVWEMLKQSDEVVEDCLHNSNAEMLLRIGEATGRSVSSEELDDTWMWVTFGTAEASSDALPPLDA